MSDDKVLLKCAWRLIPFMTLLYLVNFLDRVNVGFAALTMNRDLHLSPAVFGFGAGIFFVGYAAFQVPANVILQRIGARRWICLIMLLWGAISASTAFVQTATGLYVLRFLLGAAEAGFVPGMFFYLTLWFPPAYRARFIATFMMAAPLSGVIGSPLSGYLLNMEGVLGLHGWQWLFLIEGVPACVLGLVVLYYLPDNPLSASWLSSDERRTIAARLATEDTTHHHHDLWRALLDPRVIALGLVNFGVLAGANGVSLWLPQIVQSTFGLTNVLTGFVVALPNLVSAVVMVLWGLSSDSKDERVWHVAIPALVASSSFMLASFTQIDVVMLIALSLTQVMLWSAIAPLIALPSTFLSGQARAGGIALVVSIGQIGSFSGSWLIGSLKERTGDYAASMAAVGLILLVSGLIVLAFGRASRQSENRDAQPSRAS